MPLVGSIRTVTCRPDCVTTTNKTESKRKHPSRQARQHQHHACLFSRTVSITKCRCSHCLSLVLCSKETAGPSSPESFTLAASELRCEFKRDDESYFTPTMPCSAADVRLGLPSIHEQIHKTESSSPRVSLYRSSSHPKTRGTTLLENQSYVFGWLLTTARLGGRRLVAEWKAWL